ncbi:hypothetical protein SISSUDRAFT_1037715 [Sistotremastrum suecicum HHB10207 ss-3]|uniref:Uncharacterized protein n=1 Tax=Sistotremastrum suecicum HHB10207 ss-3 TaxID=1314776 RepID=A0A165XRL4_9AGAM|nr:hypothetical protein SISSUDRAFT_1037715 [Sistotremastrum suecicum HHB10207 ss-3]
MRRRAMRRWAHQAKGKDLGRDKGVTGIAVNGDDADAPIPDLYLMLWVLKSINMESEWLRSRDEGYASVGEPGAIFVVLCPNGPPRKHLTIVPLVQESPFAPAMFTAQTVHPFPIARYDVARVYANQNPSFMPSDLIFYRDKDCVQLGVHVVDLKTPISLSVRRRGRFQETLSIADVVGPQLSGKPEHIIFGWHNLRELFLDDEQSAQLPMHGETLSHIAYVVASMTRLFLVQNWGRPDILNIWHGRAQGGQDFDLSKLILVALRNCSVGVWQPIFEYGPRSA